MKPLFNVGDIIRWKNYHARVFLVLSIGIKMNKFYKFSYKTWDIKNKKYFFCFETEIELL